MESGSTPPPPTGSSFTYVHLLADMDMERPQRMSMATYTMLAMVAWNASTALGGRGHLVAPPPIHWVMHACYHLPTQYSITILKLKFRTYFEINISGNFLRLMFVYTTSNIYLIPSFNFNIYISNFCELVTYLCLLKEIMLLMINNNQLYCMI